MRAVSLTYSHKPDWFYKLANETDAEIKDEKTVHISETFGNGRLYFTPVTPEISSLFVDVLFTIPIQLTRYPTEEDFYIIHYDLSDSANIIQVGNVRHKIGHTVNSGMLVLENKTLNTFEPAVGKPQFMLILLVNKSLLNNIIESAADYKNGNAKIKVAEKQLFFYDYVESNSKVLIRSLKNRIIDDTFDTYIKGITLKLLANFINRYSKTSKDHHLTHAEIHGMNETIQYMQDNLYGLFPSVLVLAEIAAMSISKYKFLFQKMFDDTPNHYFIKRKMELAKQLLESGDYNTIAEVTHKLKYVNLNHFSHMYSTFYNRTPTDDFIKNDTIN
ncbi:AraC family transcriptional regulator [Flavobacterium bizetiae]|uniref:helix-turn-helix domain-containing protein n=1 Tax=Flavobacterium bizetiae TaxID=2704140 RepID=UPI0021E948E6|nr:AraC family transcriptional regulator [Flavobacterium bizetiae]UTN04865.1 AraC family transcriptional regulator [Flavobacterium bizetiae]